LIRRHKARSRLTGIFSVLTAAASLAVVAFGQQTGHPSNANAVEVVTYAGTINLAAAAQTNTVQFIPLTNINITRLEWSVTTAAAGCTTSPVVTVTIAGTPGPIAATITNGPFTGTRTVTQSVLAGQGVSVHTTTAFAGCTTSPSLATLVIHYSEQ
jgi:hypothetical protein